MNVVSRPNTLVPDSSATPSMVPPGEVRARNGGTSAPSASSVWDVAPSAPAPTAPATEPAVVAEPVVAPAPSPSPPLDPPRQRGPLLGEPIATPPPVPPAPVAPPVQTPLPTTPTARRKAKARRALELAAAERAGAPTSRPPVNPWLIAVLVGAIAGAAVWALFLREGDEPAAAVPVGTLETPATVVAGDGTAPRAPAGEGAAAPTDTTSDGRSTGSDEPVVDVPSRPLVGLEARRADADTADFTDAAPATTIPATTIPATTIPATTIPATTTPTTTTPATTAPTTTSPATTVAPVAAASAAAASAIVAPDAVAPVAAGPRITIEPRTEPCKYGANCLVVGFSLSGFPDQPDSFVCEFADGSRYTIRLAHMSVSYACSTGTAGGSITIEIGGIRSDTIVHG